MSYSAVSLIENEKKEARWNTLRAHRPLLYFTVTENCVKMICFWNNLLPDYMYFTLQSQALFSIPVHGAFSVFARDPVSQLQLRMETHKNQKCRCWFCESSTDRIQSRKIIRHQNRFHQSSICCSCILCYFCSECHIYKNNKSLVVF